jgi:hypothetical protein
MDLRLYHPLKRTRCERRGYDRCVECRWSLGSGTAYPRPEASHRPHEGKAGIVRSLTLGAIGPASLNLGVISMKGTT